MQVFEDFMAVKALYGDLSVLGDSFLISLCSFFRVLIVLCAS